MSHDNVTPFRRRPPPKRAPSDGGGGLNTPRGRAMLVQALAIIAFIVMFVYPRGWQNIVGFGIAIAGLLIAMAHRLEPMPWARTHQEHGLRTIIFGGAIWVLSGALGYLGPLAVAIPFLYIGVLIWVVVRAGVGLVLAIMRRPIWRPTGILF